MTSALQLRELQDEYSDELFSKKVHCVIHCLLCIATRRFTQQPTSNQSKFLHRQEQMTMAQRENENEASHHRLIRPSDASCAPTKETMRCLDPCVWNPVYGEGVSPTPSPPPLAPSAQQQRQLSQTIATHGHGPREHAPLAPGGFSLMA